MSVLFGEIVYHIACSISVKQLASGLAAQAVGSTVEVVADVHRPEAVEDAETVEDVETVEDTEAVEEGGAEGRWHSL